MLDQTDLTQFEAHIVPGWHVAVPAKYFAMAWEFRNGQFLQHCDKGPKLGSDMLHHTDLTQFGMWPSLPNIWPGSGNFEMVDPFYRGFSTGIRASN
jgi:hypothetical protein